jgi:3-oxoacyl-[acyl-carrier-protein] synthase-3
MKVNILSIAKYLPIKRISSETLDIQVNGVIGRIEKNTGVKYRHHVSDGENVANMGAWALEKALTKVGLVASDLDLLIFAGASFDFPIPHNSVIIKSRITDDDVRFACLDIDSTCLSFLNALDIANLYLQAGRYQKIAIVCSEIASKALSPSDEKVFGLFGDAAVAMIVEASSDKGFKNTYVDFQTYPSGALLAHVAIGGAMNRGRHADSDDLGYYFKMDGKNLIRLTIKHLDSFIAKIEQNTNIKINNFDKIIAHQTSKYGNSYFLENFHLSHENVVETLSDYGNCISASIPLGLELFINGEFNTQHKKILLLGSGAGLSLGAMVLQFD